MGRIIAIVIGLSVGCGICYGFTRMVYKKCFEKKLGIYPVRAFLILYVLGALIGLVLILRQGCQ